MTIRALVAVVGSVLAATVLTACAQAPAPPVPVARWTPIARPTTVTAPVAAAAAKVRSARFTMTETLGTATLTHTGSRTFAGPRRAVITGVLDQDGQYEVRQVGGLLYVRMPLLENEYGRPWVRLDHLSGILSGRWRDLVALLRQRVDLTAQASPVTAAALLATTASLEQGSARAVRGVRVAHYEGTLDLAKAVRRPDLRAALAAFGDGRPVAGMTVQLDVGPRSLPVRLVLDFHSAYGPGHVVIDYLAFDVPVRVVVPPAAQVDDLGMLLVGA